MSACHSCDHYSARDRWCSALEDRVIHPEGGRCSAHSRPDPKPGACVSCAGKGHRMLADYRGGPLQKVECWWCSGAGSVCVTCGAPLRSVGATEILPGHRACAHSRGADACCTCSADEEDQCSACAFGAGEEAI